MPEADEFINECCDLGYDYRIQSSALYDAYTAWCKRRKIWNRSPNQMAPEWERLGFKKTRIDGRAYWRGVRLKTE